MNVIDCFVHLLNVNPLTLTVAIWVQIV